MSEFIERSKHQEMTSKVQAHILSGAKPDTRGLKSGGGHHIDSTSIESDFFNGETGVNYTPRSKASSHAK